jgi:hypothetical protein
MLTVGTLHNIGARLEHTPRKLHKRLDQETGVSKSSARMAATRVHFYSWFLQSVIEGEIDPRLTFFSEACFHLQRYIHTYSIYAK